MTITIGTTTLNATSAYAFRYSNGKLVLKLDIPQTEIGHDELKTLLKDNDEDIIVTKDDNSTETFTGFTYTLTILDHDDVYSAEVECIGEAERKIALMQNTINAQSALIQAQGDEITAQGDEMEGYITDNNDTSLTVSECLDELLVMVEELADRVAALEALNTTETETDGEEV